MTMEKSQGKTDLMKLETSSGRSLGVKIGYKPPSVRQMALLVCFSVIVSVGVLVTVVVGFCISQAQLHEASQMREVKLMVQISAMNKSISDKDHRISELTSQLAALNDTDKGLSGKSLVKCGDTASPTEGTTATPAATTDMNLANTTYTTPISPIKSCSHLPSNSSSGYYWVMASNGSAIRVFCDMNRTCGSVTGGWMRVASMDMAQTSSQCPVGLCVSKTPVRTCRICSQYRELSYHELYRVNVSYSKVCGRVIAYQIGSPDGYHSRFSKGLDGVLLTYGYPDVNIWAFVATISKTYRSPFLCSCMNPNDSSIPVAPAFIGNHYFCDSAPRKANFNQALFYSDDPLWDGAGCEGANMCCTFNNPPWFYRELPEPITEDIKLKVKLDEASRNEDIAIEKIDIYIQ